MIVPKTSPTQSQADTLALLAKYEIKTKVAILGVRGHYSEMGKPGKNDRGIYDDAIFILAPDCYLSFNANCDPGKFKKGIATLNTGIWYYKVGIHGLDKASSLRYKALIQADKVTVTRDGLGEDTGYFGINIHKGGYATVSSLGCQTIHPDQWVSFIETIKAQLEKHDKRTVPYVLVEV